MPPNRLTFGDNAIIGPANGDDGSGRDIELIAILHDPARFGEQVVDLDSCKGLWIGHGAYDFR